MTFPYYDFSKSFNNLTNASVQAKNSCDVITEICSMMMEELLLLQSSLVVGVESVKSHERISIIKHDNFYHAQANNHPNALLYDKYYVIDQ